MRFQMIGMKLDQSGQDVVAVHVHAHGRPAVCELCNHSVPDNQASLHDPVFEHEPRIRQNGLRGHSGSLSVLIERKRRPAVNCKWRTRFRLDEEAERPDRNRPGQSRCKMASCGFFDPRNVRVGKGSPSASGA